MARTDSALPLLGVWVPSLVGELRSCKLHSVAKKKKKPQTRKRDLYNLLSWTFFFFLPWQKGIFWSGATLQNLEPVWQLCSTKLLRTQILPMLLVVCVWFLFSQSPLDPKGLQSIIQLCLLYLILHSCHFCYHMSGNVSHIKQFCDTS